MNNASYNIIIQFPKVKLKISTNYRSYYDYLNLYFNKIIAQDNNQDNCQIDIQVNWDKDYSNNTLFTQLQNTPAMLQIGANTYMSDDRIVTLRKIEKRTKVLFDFQREKNKILLKSLLQWKGLKDIIRYRFFQKAEEEKFFTVTYHAVYYPLFWYYERFLSAHILHSSCVSYEGKAVLLCGLEGIGKTSFSLSLLEENGVSFLSDNLIFFDANNVYPCFELMRLHKSDTLKFLGGRFEKANAFRTQKDFYAPASSIPQEGIKPFACIFLSFCPHMYMKEMTINEAVSNAILLSHLPAELNNYVEYRHLYNLLDLSVNPWKSQYSALKELLQNTKCYVVGLPKSDGLEKNSKRLKEIINSLKDN